MMVLISRAPDSYPVVSVLLSEEPAIVPPVAKIFILGNSSFTEFFTVILESFTDALTNDKGPENKITLDKR